MLLSFLLLPFFKLCSVDVLCEEVTWISSQSPTPWEASPETTPGSEPRASASLSEQQHFMVRPSSVEAVEGATVLLQCQVGGRAGKVQWSKNGFLLGYDKEIPGFPRYRILGDHEDGFFNLQINHVQIDDEAEYQCQVGPAPNQEPIRSSSNLTVIVPPTSVKINGMSVQSVVSVRESQKVALTCVAAESKPPATLKWFRKNTELISEATKLTVSRATKCTKCRVTSNTVMLYPKAADNGTVYSCEASHKAWSSPGRAAAVLSVLHKPSFPEISGYRSGDVLYAGDSLQLTCSVRGGNPWPRVVWFRGSSLVDEHWVVSGRDVINIHTISINAAENNAVYTCQAQNNIMNEPYRIHVSLNVFYPSDQVVIQGPHWGQRGSKVTLSCQSGASNPESQLSWTMDGVRVYDAQNQVISSGLGWRTLSNLTVTLTRQVSDTNIFNCRSETLPMHFTVMATHEVRVLYPPSVPIITGLDPDLKESDQCQLLCLADRGNPPATLRWYRDNQLMSSTTSMNRDDVTSELTFGADRSYHRANIRCEVNNTAEGEALSSSVQIIVKFPPRNLTAMAIPSEARNGRNIYLLCVTDASNPGSTLTWEVKGTRYQTGTELSEILFGSYVARSSLNLTATPDLDRTLAVCHAHTQGLQGQVTGETIIRVKYAPILSDRHRTLTLETGWTGVVNFSCQANPDEVVYTWSRPNRSSVRPDGPLLRIQGLKLDDAGTYQGLVQNSEGSNSVSLTIHVLPENLTQQQQQHQDHESRPVVVKDEAVTQSCSLDRSSSSQVSRVTVRWRRLTGWPAKSASQPLLPSQCLLLLGNLSSYDVDACQCVAIRELHQHDIGTDYFTLLNGVMFQRSLSVVQALQEGEGQAVVCCLVEGPGSGGPWGSLAPVPSVSSHLSSSDALPALSQGASRCALYLQNRTDPLDDCQTRNNFHMLVVRRVSDPSVPSTDQAVLVNASGAGAEEKSSEAGISTTPLWWLLASAGAAGALGLNVICIILSLRRRSARNNHPPAVQPKDCNSLSSVGLVQLGEKPLYLYVDDHCAPISSKACNQEIGIQHECSCPSESVPLSHHVSSSSLRMGSTEDLRISMGPSLPNLSGELSTTRTKHCRRCRRVRWQDDSL